MRLLSYILRHRSRVAPTLAHARARVYRTGTGGRLSSVLELGKIPSVGYGGGVGGRGAIMELAAIAVVERAPGLLR